MVFDFRQVLSDDSKRSQYDQWGSASQSMGGGAGGHAAGGPQWQGFHSTIDPEELFRKIFGDFARASRGGGGGGKNPFESAFEDFAGTAHGFGSSQEVWA